MKNSSTQKEKAAANEFCVKQLAVDHLMEKSKCAEKAGRYIDYVFEKCKNDLAPMNQNKISKLKSFSDIMWKLALHLIGL